MNNKKHKKVIMSTVFMVQTETGISLTDLTETGDGYVDIGGFEVVANGKTITFDFESNSWWKNHGQTHTYTYSNYNGFAEKIHAVDPCHEEYWAKAGLKPEDITAELLGSAEELVDFYLAVYDKNHNPIPYTLEVQSMVFENENGNVFAIHPDVLQAFNRQLDHEKKEMSLHIQTADDDEFEERYSTSCTNGDYSPSCPWNAPGMSIRDFI